MLLAWFTGGVLVGVVGTVVATSLWPRLGAAATRRRSYLLGTGLVAALVAAAVIIHTLSTRQVTQPAMAMAAPTASGGGTASGAMSMDAAVAGLEARLARGGGSDADWTLLAQAYDFLGRKEDAERARKHIPSPKAAGAALSAATIAAASASLDAPGAAASSANPSANVAGELTAGGNAQDWLAIADARRAQRDFAGARAAYDKAIERKEMTAQSWADYADTVASLQGGSLAGPAGGAIDQALTLDPTNVKALWLKASQAHEQRRYTEALTWWGRLRAVLPPNSQDARVIDGNIAEDKALAGNDAVTQPASPALAQALPSAVSGTVSVDSRYAGRIGTNDTLFIYAKSVDSPGPPLAVLRTAAAHWPVSFRLDDTLAMLPGRKLSLFDRVVVEARISHSGQAAPVAGDLYATSPVLRPADGRKLALVINHEIG